MTLTNQDFFEMIRWNCSRWKPAAEHHIFKLLLWNKKTETFLFLKCYHLTALQTINLHVILCFPPKITASSALSGRRDGVLSVTIRSTIMAVRKVRLQFSLFNKPIPAKSQSCLVWRIRDRLVYHINSTQTETEIPPLKMDQTNTKFCIWTY